MTKGGDCRTDGAREVIQYEIRKEVDFMGFIVFTMMVSDPELSN